MDEPTLTGRLLVSAPLLEDPSFRRSVVFVVDDAEDGTLGVVLNRPSELRVDDVVPGWGAYASEPAVMFAGGPVGAGSGLALGVAGGGDPPGWQPLKNAEPGSASARLGIVDLDAPAEILGGALERLRVFAGYSGWNPGQLREEIDEGAWYVVSSAREDVFAAAPAELWSRVLRRQGGDLALVSTFPDDPTMN